MQYVPQIIVFVVIWYQPILSIFTRLTLLLPSNTAPVEQSWRTSRWRHQMGTFSVLLALCAGNLPVTGEFPAQRPVTQSVDAFFDLRLNKFLSKQSWCWWFEMPSCPLWRHRDDGNEYLRAYDITIRKQSIAKQCTHRIRYILLSCFRPSRIMAVE